jgi:uncharacterized protein DUF551
MTEDQARLMATIREKLYPTRRGYCAEPLDIDEARWLLMQLETRLGRPVGPAETLEHLRDDRGQCLSGCYACERRGLQERIRFTADYESLQAEVARLRIRSGFTLPEPWQPIETAPKDRTEILVFHIGSDEAGYMSVVWWDEFLDGWLVAALADENIYVHPTHWMPLPAAPGGSEAVRTRTEPAVSRLAPNGGEFGAIHHQRSEQMEAVMIPAKTLVHIGGVPVCLATDTIIETAHENMRLLTGYHYASLLAAPAVVPAAHQLQEHKEDQTDARSRTGE